MGLCTVRRVYLLFLTVTILQIVTTGARQVFDFLGPLWSMILTNFLNVVFCILGFFGGYTKTKQYLVSYTIWSLLWIAWNLFIICLYIPLPRLEQYKSPVLSLGTGGFSYWETRAPGCIPDWTSETQFMVTNCMFNPRLMEFIQAGIQVYLAFTGFICALSMIICPQLYTTDDKDSKQVAQHGTAAQGTVPPFLSLSRQNVSNHNRTSSRMYNRAPMGLPSANNNGGDSSDQVGGNMGDDRLRPMTPRRVKRRSARSIQSQRYGPNKANHNPAGDVERPSTSRGSTGGGSSRSSLRSNASRRSAQHRSSKRKSQFVSPVNRLMQQQQQQQVDSETSHDEPRRYLLRDQGHVNPVYQGPQSPTYARAPPRPPSARSSYSNYHPARIPLNPKSDLLPNVINLNQNIFTNGAFDMSTEYNMSQHSNNASTALYEDEVNFHPNLSPVTNNPPIPPPANLKPNPALTPNGINLSFKPQNTAYNALPPQPPKPSYPARTEQTSGGGGVSNPLFAYPLAHSPVSQESFPMWGVSQPQSPISNHFPSPPYQNRRPGPIFPMKLTNTNPNPQQLQRHSQQANLSSETVI